MNTVSLIISIVLSVIALAVVVIAALLGYKRGVIKSLLRFGTILISAVISFVLALTLPKAFKAPIENLISTLYNDDSIKELLEASPTLEALLTDLPLALVAPFVFALSFIILSLLMLIAYKLLGLIPIFKKRLLDNKLPIKLKAGGLIGTAVGILTGLIIVSCCFMPIAGVTALAKNTVDEVVESGTLESDDPDNNTVETLNTVKTDLLDPLNSSVALSFTRGFFGNLLFDSTFSVKIDGNKVAVSEEVASILSTVSTLNPLIESKFDLAHFGDEEADSLRGFAEHIDDSKLILAVAGEVVPFAAKKWNSNQTFMGAENPIGDVPEVIEPLINDIFIVLESTSKETLAQDITTVADVFATLAESGTFAVMSSDVSAQDFIKSLSTEGTITHIIDTLYANERTRILVADVANLGFEAVGDALDIPENDEAVKAELIVNLNEQIANTANIENDEERIKVLSFKVENVFAKYGVDVNASDAKLYAECLDCARDKSAEKVFEEINATVNSSTAEGSDIVYMSTSSKPQSDIAAIVNAYISADNASLPAISSLSAQISGRDVLVHKTITKELLLVSTNDILNLSHEEMTRDATAIEEILTALAGVIVTDESGHMSFELKNLDTQKLSNALARLSTSTENPNENINKLSISLTNIVKCSLQSVGFDASAADKFVDHVANSGTVDTTTGEVVGNDKVLSTAVGLVDMVNSDASKEDVSNTVNTLINDIDKDTANVLADVVTPNLIDKCTDSSLSYDRTQAISTVTQDILTNFGEISETLTEEQAEAEATTLQTVFELAMTSGNSENADSLFAGEGKENTALDKTATEFVDTVKQSVVVQNTIVEQTDTLKTAVGDSMSQTDKAELANALQNDTEISSELKDALVTAFSLEALMGGVQ